MQVCRLGEPQRCTDGSVQAVSCVPAWRLLGGATLGSVTFTPPRLRLYHHSAPCTTTSLLYQVAPWVITGHVILTRTWQLCFCSLLNAKYLSYKSSWWRVTTGKSHVHTSSWVKMLLVSQFWNVTVTHHPTFVCQLLHVWGSY